jgi:mannose-1-phosphate guanylyltransferase
MDAVILVGGEGTRLRPLTLAQPKSMLPLVDRPFLAYPFQQLRRAGVDRVILSCGYLPDAIQATFGHDGGAFVDGLRIEYAVEPAPLDTAGAIRFAAAGRVSETFLVLNGDVLSDFDLGSLVARHKATGARATIALTPVEDPSRYGLVRTAADGSVLGFLEKPKPEEIDTNLINAGAYVLEPDVLDAIAPDRRVNIEREIFPALIGRGLYAHAMDGYWVDIGTPASYLAAHAHLLDSMAQVASDADVADDAELVEPVWIGPGARVASGARIGPWAAVGAGAVVGEGSVVEGAVVHDEAWLAEGCRVLRSVVGAGATLGAGCDFDELAMVGADVEVAGGTVLREGARLYPAGSVL